MTDSYRYCPTLAEIQALRPKEGNFKVSGDGIFATRQGEGVTAGMNAVFLRLHFCNLACGRDGGWKCDTWYTWDKQTREFWQESQDITPEAVAQKVVIAWTEKFGLASDHRIVVTGGEPLLQQREIAKLLKFLPGWKVEVETNGTIIPISELHDCQFNCSPKLANSGNGLNRRYRPQVLNAIAGLPNSWFKFVVTSVQDLDEVKTMVIGSGIPDAKVLIMPEGNSVEIVQSRLNSLQDQVVALGWQTTNRNQLIWFGNQRRT